MRKQKKCCTNLTAESNSDVIDRQHSLNPEIMRMKAKVRILTNIHCVPLKDNTQIEL